MRASTSWRAAILILMLVGCGGGKGTRTDGAGTGGAFSDGRGADAGRDGAGGANLDGPAVSCPPAAPRAGGGCTGTPTCFYEDCAGAGRTSASCVGGTWRVETAACNEVSCRSMTCKPGEVCMEVVSGALLVSCIANSCGAGPVSCACLGCAGCAVSTTLQGGIKVMCSNTCSDPRGCP